MKLDILLNEDGTIQCEIKSPKFDGGFITNSADGAILELQKLIKDEEKARTSIKEKIKTQLEEFELGETKELDTLDKELSYFRVRLTTISRSINMKFKTKAKDGKLIATRIA